MKSGEQPDRSPDRPCCYCPSYDRANYDRANYERANYERASYRVAESASLPAYRPNSGQPNFALADIVGTLIALVSLTLPLLTISSYSSKIILPQPTTQLLQPGKLP
ncbi:MAG: hypothetical protein SFW36_00770 [Leptolyngbyaceae cyanobacterium bins.59]|nr:hypothetical protein [Leptolyngbyaceae cyanobacterium bins.59]